MNPEDSYSQQHRGDRGAYDRYLKSMDASMKQKVALTAAHLLCQGSIADMGMGSATGSHALASLYPALQVIGVDVNQTMVERARERYKLDNLSFIQGDIAKPCFADQELDSIFNSSVLHHVTSFNDYSHDQAAEALRVQVKQLKPDGVLIVRDFISPGQGPVWLDLPTDDGDDSDDPESCSSARLFERFAKEFRKLSGTPGFDFEVLAPSDQCPLREGRKRYRVDHRMAAEFVLRKDYKADWDSEVLEEYTYFDQRQFEQHFARLGLRLLASTPIWNPWIVTHRFRDQFELWTDDGQELEFPPTNYLIVGERAPKGQGVCIEPGEDVERLNFLVLNHYRNRQNQRVMDLVRRPHLTVDVLPWFEADGDVFVIARKSYPRPILGALGHDSLDGSTAAVYITEPLSVLQDDKPLGQTVEEALSARASIASHEIHAFHPGGHYYPSPGGIQEEVRALHVQVDPVFVEKSVGNLSGFSNSGQIRAMESQQVLRAAQVGGLPNARLEINVYDLLLRLGRKPGVWIGETITLSEGRQPARIHSLGEFSQRPARRMFEQAEAKDSSGFLKVECSRFRELDAEAQALTEKTYEYVRPRELSSNTMAVALLRQHQGEVYLGLDDDDLPAAQCFTGNSNILVTPAWRLPQSLRSLTPARRWILKRLEQEYGLDCGASWELGGRYHPSPGCTPETVYPIAIEVREESSAGRDLIWVKLRSLIQEREALFDGHLTVLALRAGHALGLL